MTNASVSGESIDIGEYKVFNQRNKLDALFSGFEKELFIAWISLQPNQTIPVHKRSMSSLIIVCKGAGKCIGEYDADLQEGDAISVPAETLHGLIANQNEPLTCLCIQSDGKPIYHTDDVKHRVKSEPANYFEAFISSKNKFEEQFRQVCQQTQKKIQENGLVFEKVFYGYLKRWSQSFQQILFLRQSLVSDAEFSKIFSQHLDEEIGHDKYLEKFVYIKNQDIEAYCAWFERKIQLVSDVEKAIIVHTVLETAGEIFSANIQSRNKGKISEYIELHAELDEGHANICDPHIKDYVYSNFNKAVELCSDSWEILIKLFTTILSLSVSQLKT
ncbi:cupin domain-containing protein [Spartinivicinus poritis]|uniref:Cupin domain-containing protein n=1 Tax=Spartinivicinus poritis TaxID=2994640 RepID=A0ABT5U8P4_9GAMM|nr:cupin domain-containing protein [Spartinivicinus sp. A2-2]MDE1462743.1 cupin domain-containing protein [Spartinivicinus sp. A2-2]